ncbi:MAG: nuclear transport factor 2 family protein [Candidatus Acidiferrum sp.]|jgi:ketosteroid isomerase-like protein
MNARWIWLGGFGVIAWGLALSASGGGIPSGREEVGRFNEHYRERHLKMDTAGIFELWADDGVDLMPGEAPMIGKKVIQEWVEGILAKMPGYKVVKQEMEFHDIQVAGDWASEWALEHQVVQPPNGNEPIETWGKMALVLHRDESGGWKVKQEMWNAAPKN